MTSSQTSNAILQKKRNKSLMFLVCLFSWSSDENIPFIRQQIKRYATRSTRRPCAKKKEKKKEARKKCFSLFKLIDTQKIGTSQQKRTPEINQKNCVLLASCRWQLYDTWGRYHNDTPLLIIPSTVCKETKKYRHKKVTNVPSFFFLYFFPPLLSS